MTIGAFDGVHRGHQHLIRQVIDRARHEHGVSTVVTFDPRPQVVLRDGSQQLTDGREKERLISSLGPDTLVILPFNRALAHVPAEQFLLSLLDGINITEIWIGADFAFGHNRVGNVDFLIRRGQDLGFSVHVVAPLRVEGARISSSTVRECVAKGEVAEAAVLMGHYLRVRGPVERGHGRGVDLGFPTANIGTSATQLLPGTGIYAAYLHVDGTTLAAAVSVGYNVQFNGERLTVEAFALDFEGDLREQTVDVEFVDRIRDERRFENVEALIAAMHDDVVRVRQVLAQRPCPR
ncbi:MAG: bifunctional riboflavin kinase/FAD synthetase [Chloroflexota bacterium]